MNKLMHYTSIMCVDIIFVCICLCMCTLKVTSLLCPVPKHYTQVGPNLKSECHIRDLCDFTEVNEVMPVPCTSLCSLSDSNKKHKSTLRCQAVLNS